MIPPLSKFKPFFLKRMKGRVLNITICYLRWHYPVQVIWVEASLPLSTVFPGSPVLD